MAGVSTLGIGSGLKLSDILDKLTSAENKYLPLFQSSSPLRPPGSPPTAR